MMPDETADFAIPKPEFKYNKDIFLNKMFTRSDEYLNADDKDKVNFGRDLNTQATCTHNHKILLMLLIL